MPSTHDIGKKGEEIAKNYLEKKNYILLDKNWRSGKYGELDLVVKDEKTNEIVFVEVKTRETSTKDAKELVTPKKQEKLYKLAKSYLYKHRLKDPACRFDVIAIRISGDIKELEHIRNAFYL